MENKNFIMTNSRDTALLLKQMGLTCVQEQNEKWFFVNEPKALMFKDVKNIVYTNKLFI